MQKFYREVDHTASTSEIFVGDQFQNSKPWFLNPLA